VHVIGPRSKVYLAEVKTLIYEGQLGGAPTDVVTCDLYTLRNGKRTKRPVSSCARGGTDAMHRAIMGAINGYVGPGGFACTSTEPDGTKSFHVRERNGITYPVHVLPPVDGEEGKKTSQHA
jgi:hypothetical protein